MKRPLVRRAHTIFAMLAVSSIGFFGRGAAFVATGNPSNAAALPAPDATPPVPPEVAALRAKIEAAEGKRPHLERVTATITLLGRDVTERTVRDGENKRTTYGDGPIATADGVYDGEAWHQNANGLTVIDEAPEHGEKSERATLSVRHVTTPIVADVIADVNAKGDGTLTYVDPGSSRIVRVDTFSRSDTSVATFDDFRTTDGRTQAWHEHTVDQATGDVSDRRVTSIVTTGVTLADVAIALPRRALVAFPKGKTSVLLPVQLDSDHKFIVHLMFGDRGADFLLDTGAASIVLDTDFAKSLGLATIDQGSNVSNAGRFRQSAVVVPQMSVGELKMHDIVAVTSPNLSFANRDAPVRIVGLLGFDFIASLALKLDYQHATMTATDYDAFVAPAVGQAIAVPIRLGDQEAETDVAVDGQVGDSFFIDSGGTGGVLITDLFSRRHPGVTRGFLGGITVRITGVGGDTTAREYEVPKIRIGSATFSNFAAIVMDSPKVYSGFDGVIGPDILQLFTVTTDYADSMIYLQKNDKGQQSAAAAH